MLMVNKGEFRRNIIKVLTSFSLVTWAGVTWWMVLRVYWNIFRIGVVSVCLLLLGEGRKSMCMY